MRNTVYRIIRARFVYWLIGIFVVAAGGFITTQIPSIPNMLSSGIQTTSSSQSPSIVSKGGNNNAFQVSTGSVNDEVPSQSQINSVLTQSVKNQLGGQTALSTFGAVIVNNNETDLDADVSSAPYVNLSKQDSLGRPGVTNAWLNKSSRQYQNRNDTGNATQMEPVGWHQTKIGGKYGYLYNRGHLIGYALAGKIKGFDASEANPKNIATQTAWANQASNGDAKNEGQNYFESLVRKALDQNKRVRYRVTPIYDGDNLVPSGNHIEAKSSDKSLQFNVFVPNVQPGVSINYASGQIN